jgi:hypothetical protein
MGTYTLLYSLEIKKSYSVFLGGSLRWVKLSDNTFSCASSSEPVIIGRLE